ncbi:MAG: NAD-dependent epimerase/dehydratase family protein [Polyangiaceae bacterium]|nr:NAD-dependent epimerase/dehydratase family protein [Myxococcales bacterium]MCB9587733.1 NAD-dependent epimerase/dehydratase family protein [Polyangiaceae bacterium]
MESQSLPHFPAFEKLRGARVLITGGAGFIGSHLARRASSLGASVRILDDLSGGFLENLEGIDYEFFEGSVEDATLVERASVDVDYVFHEAAMVSVPESVEQPARCYSINNLGCQHVLESAGRAKAKRVVLASSAAAYGQTPSLPSKETDAPDCWSPYAASKVAAELQSQAWGRVSGLSSVNLRYFNVYGPRQNPNSAYAAVISAFAKALISSKQPTIFGDGSQTRDFTHVDNVVLANFLAATHDAAFMGDVFNVGLGHQTSLLDLLAAMCRTLDVDVKPAFAELRAGDVAHSCADIDRTRSALGYAPCIDFEAGLQDTLEDFKQRYAAN